VLGTVQAAVCCVSDGVGQSGLRMRIKQLAVLRPRDGSPRISVLTVVGRYTREAPATEALRILLMHEAIDAPNRPSTSHRRSVP
jgi:hypothetical protein